MVLKNRGVKPINLESNFYFEELFFSKTDLVGNILTGNDVFVRVSQYSREELIGSPHNIIRHPDMPKIVFKVLWDYLKRDKVVIAYVKNLTKEGKYYWVLAVAFPVQGGYLSIRLKPSSAYFQLIPELYKVLLEIEQANGMNASLDKLLAILQSKGFKDYDSFMSAVIINELRSRQTMAVREASQTIQPLFSDFKNNIQKNNQTEISKIFNEINHYCSNINKIFNHLFEDFEQLHKIEAIVSETTKNVLNFSELISVLSLNTSIETFRLGEQGHTLSVVSKEIKKGSDEIGAHALLATKYSNDISIYSQQLGLLSSTSQLQSDMIDFFAKELLKKVKQDNFQDSEINVSRENILLLLNLFIKTYSEVRNLLNPLSIRLNEIINIIGAIQKIIKNLDRSDVLGSIESSRIGEQGTKFSIVFTKMRESTEETREKLLKLDKYLKNLTGTIQIINDSSNQVFQYVKAINAVLHGAAFENVMQTK